LSRPKPQLTVPSTDYATALQRRLVREALTPAEPTPRRLPVRRSPRLDQVKKTVDERLRANAGGVEST
jgi:hypothetical protein